MASERPDIEELRARLKGRRGEHYWRGLEELFEDDGLKRSVAREFPRQASQLENALDRRAFFKLMGASLALAGLAGCGFRPPDEAIVPYDRQPEELVPGRPLYYATAMQFQGYATGLLVESHEGRPTKVEGNPDHPASLGATDVFAQASVLTLYDPDRSRTVVHRGGISTWESFLAEFRGTAAGLRARQGAGLHVLTETYTSPTLASQIQFLLKDYPQSAWHQYEPAGRDQLREGARLAFGDYAETVYRFDKADVVLALDADFLSTDPASVRYARDFTARRRVQDGQAEMNRLYVVESTPTNTGAMADHRLPLKASEVEGFARAVAAALGVPLGGQTGSTQPAVSNPQWLAALVRDLTDHKGACVVVAGEGQPPVVHAIAHALNQALEGVGNTVVYLEPVEASPVNQLESLRSLVQALDAGQVELLLVLGGNPAYDAPADFHFAESIGKAKARVHLGLYYDETAALSDWHVPEAHFLEAWSDARAFDGTVSIIQPLIAPLYGGKSAHEMLAALTDQPDRSGYEIVRGYWQGRMTGGHQAQTGGAQTQGQMNQNSNGAPPSPSSRASSTTQTPAPQTQTPGQRPAAPNSSDQFEQWWHRALHDGLIENTSSQPKAVALKTNWAATARGQDSGTSPGTQHPTPDTMLEIIFRPDPCVHDGRFANNAWLQELPKPLTKLTWGNAALLSPATARRLGLEVTPADTGGEHGAMVAEVVELKYRGVSLEAPAFVVPGHADDSVTVHLGFGRTRAGHVGDRVGFNAYSLRTSDSPCFGAGLEIKRLYRDYKLACTQAHHRMEGRDLVRSATLDEYRSNPSFAKREADDPAKAISLYPGWNSEGYAWGMAIDTSTCTGCNACVVACQAENNIPVVGREEVLRAREMHWLRIDRYYKGDESNPETLNQPVPCMHCETAPCEVVCPVEATSHSDEGLNEMTYNRCVGTRYCSNNCPYKVRRFNFFEYSDYETPVLKLQRNPDVTVRSRGVMEKCTYCVQRINVARIEAEKEGRAIRDGDVVTACQAACPTQAIVFGNIRDPEARVSKLKAEPRGYGLLAELNTRPRTTYLAAVRNPNPEIKPEQ
jgi:MoCo/4Fe-4S cofactor protein with predicted Tat translocation signal